MKFAQKWRFDFFEFFFWRRTENFWSDGRKNFGRSDGKFRRHFWLVEIVAIFSSCYLFRDRVISAESNASIAMEWRFGRPDGAKLAPAFLRPDHAK